MRALEIEGCVTRPLEDGDKAPLHKAFADDPVYFRATNGRDIPLEEICSALPAGRSAADKFTFAIERAGQVIGMIDVIRGYPEPDIWYLGFLFIAKEHRGGMGRQALRGLYSWAKRQGATALRLGVVEPNLKARWLYATEGFVFQAVRDIDPAMRRLRRTLVLQRLL